MIALAEAKSPMWEVNGFLDALWISLLCIAVVFVVLIVITLLLEAMNHIKALDVKETVTLKDGTKADEDMMAAILVASIDYRKTCKEDFKVASCKLIEQENKKK